MVRIHDSVDQKFYSVQECRDYISEHHLTNAKLKKMETGYWKIYLVSEYDFNLKEYLKIAQQLCYPKEAMRRLRQAKSDTEAANIMTDARKGKFDEYRYETDLQ